MLDTWVSKDDNKRLGKLLYALVKSNIQPKFSVGYTITEVEKEKYKNTLIENSVKNARERAGILAKSAGVKLGDILTIDYSDAKIDFYEDMGDYGVEKLMVQEASANNTYDFDIEADDMVISDSVSMIWEIK